MKTPKEKAEELVDKYSELGIGHPTSLLLPKRCALIAVDEIIESLDSDIYIQGETDIDSYIEYFKEVKQEIEKL